MTDEPKPAEQPALNMVERAEKAVADMKEQTDRYAELVKQNQEASARAMLGGGTTGNIPAPQPKEETPKEYMQKVMSGKV